MPSAAAVDQGELSFVMAKRFIETVACGELEVVDEGAGCGFVKCMNCVPLVKININGGGSLQQRMKQHINSEAHRKSKCQDISLACLHQKYLENVHINLERIFCP